MFACRPTCPSSACLVARLLTCLVSQSVRSSAYRAGAPLATGRANEPSCLSRRWRASSQCLVDPERSCMLNASVQGKTKIPSSSTYSLQLKKLQQIHPLLVSVCRRMAQRRLRTDGRAARGTRWRPQRAGKQRTSVAPPVPQSNSRLLKTDRQVI